MGRIGITGIGPVTPIGIGKDEFWSAMEKGLNAIRKLDMQFLPPNTCCGVIGDLNLDAYIDGRRFRRAARVSQYTLIAAALALGDAKCTPPLGPKSALVMGITHGSLHYSETFHASLVKEGPDALSPIHFSDSVLNAPAGNTSICFDIEGPMHTLLGGPECAVKAVMLGSHLIDGGSVDRSIIIAAEELNHISLYCYTRLGLDPLSEGAAALVIERVDCTDRTSPYCYLSGMASQLYPANPEAALLNVVHKALEVAGLRIAEVDLMIANVPVIAGFPHTVPVVNVAPFTGYAFSVTTLWHVTLAAMVIRNGSIPKAFIGSDMNLPTSIAQVLICAADGFGAAAALVLSSTPGT